MTAGLVRFAYDESPCGRKLDTLVGFATTCVSVVRIPSEFVPVLVIVTIAGKVVLDGPSETGTTTPIGVEAVEGMEVEVCVMVEPLTSVTEIAIDANRDGIVGQNSETRQTEWYPPPAGKVVTDAEVKTFETVVKLPFASVVVT